METSSDSPSYSAEVELRLLGGFSIRIGERLIDDAEWRLRKAKSIVKLLAISPGYRLHRERIMDLVWPDLGPEAAGNNLRQVVHVARHVLEPFSPSPRSLRLQDDSYLLWTADLLHTDVVAFERAASAARQSRDPASYRAVLELYTGDLLPDDPYEDWALGRREELRSTQLALLEELAELYEERSERRLAAETLQRVVAMDPLHEEAYVRLMKLYARDGKRQLVKRQYRQLRMALSRELEVSPDPATEALYREILSGKIPTSAALAAPGPQRIPTVTRKDNLPAALTSFIGREQEIAAVRGLLSTGRLVSVVGPGGAGKSRLAQEVARTLLPAYTEGVWLVDLSPLSDPDLLWQAIATQIGVREMPRRPLAETMVDFLRDKITLLVLDNCEHLLDACARLVDSILLECPEVSVLVTSRQALNVPGEAIWRITSLSLPDRATLPEAKELSRYEAVRLLVERARLVRPEFQLDGQNAAAVVEICRKLDGMPLAIELAAARTKVLTPEQIASRLEARFSLLYGESSFVHPRHQTLRAVIDWSYSQLSPERQRLFEHLSVFAGGWTLEAAEAVCCVKGSTQRSSPVVPGSWRPPAHTVQPSVLDTLTSLVDRSLVVADPGQDGGMRYQLLETVREYARERLVENGEAEAMRRQHAEFYLAVAETAEPQLSGPGQAVWLDRLELEHDNFRTALRWSLEAGEAEVALRLAAALGPFWTIRGHHGEGRSWLTRALALETNGTRAVRMARSRALGAAGYLAQLTGEFGLAHALYDENLALSRALEHAPGIADALQNLGMGAAWAGEFAAAHALLEESLAIHRQLGNRWGTSYSLHFLGQLAWFEGDLPLARRYLDECRQINLELGDRRAIAYTLLVRAGVDTDAGSYAAAHEGLAECLAMFNGLGEMWGLPFAVFALAVLLAAEGRHEVALRLEGSAAAMREHVGDPLPPAFKARTDSYLQMARRALGEAASAAALAEGRAMPLPQVIAEALASAGASRPAAGPAVAAGAGELAPLSKREVAVAALIARGLTNRRIAGELAIGEGTVANHVERILRKLGLSSRAQIAVWAVERQLSNQ